MFEKQNDYFCIIKLNQLIGRRRIMKSAKRILINMKHTINFIRDGLKCLSISANSQYNNHTDEMNRIKKEMFENSGTFRNDKENLIKDKKAIASDIRRAFNNLVIDNG